MKICYTYLIGWSKENKYYYGCQYGKKAHPSNIWVTYFTSSKYVKSFALKYGKPDIIQIRKTSNSPEKIKIWEDTVLRRIGATFSDKFLNLSNNNSFKNMVMTDKIRRRISEVRLENSKNLPKKKLITNGKIQKYINESYIIPVGWYYGQSDKVKLSNTQKDYNLNKNKTEEEKKIIYEKISKALKGKPKPPGHGANVSKALKGKSKPWQIGANNVSNRQDVKDKISKSWETREIGIWYTDGVDNFYIKEGDYINPLWKRGKSTKIKSHWYTNGVDNFYIKEGDYINPLWKRGKSTKIKKHWYNNGILSKYFGDGCVPPDFIKGRLFSERGMKNIKEANSKPKSEEHKKNLSKSKRKHA